MKTRKRLYRISTVCEVRRYSDGRVAHWHWKTYKHTTSRLKSTSCDGYHSEICIDICQKPLDAFGRYILPKPLVTDA